MRSRMFNFDEKNKSNRIIRSKDAGSSGRQVNISGSDKSHRPRKRTKKSAKDLLIDNAEANTKFLSEAQVAELADFAGVSKEYGERKLGQKVSRNDPYTMKPGETSDEYLTRVRAMFAKE